MRNLPLHAVSTRGTPYLAVFLAPILSYSAAVPHVLSDLLAVSWIGEFQKLITPRKFSCIASRHFVVQIAFSGRYTYCRRSLLTSLAALIPLLHSCPRHGRGRLLAMIFEAPINQALTTFSSITFSPDNPLLIPSPAKHRNYILFRAPIGSSYAR